MVSKRYLLSRFLNSISLFDILARYTPETRLIVLAYHRICDKPAQFLLDEDVISATPADFENQLRFIEKHFSVSLPDSVAFHPFPFFRVDG